MVLWVVSLLPKPRTMMKFFVMKVVFGLVEWRQEAMLCGYRFDR